MTDEFKEVEKTDDEERRRKILELCKMGYQLLKENKLDEAAECFAQALSLEENNNYALVGMGDVSRKQRNFREAVAYYQRCLDYFPGNNYALFGLADCLKALNQFRRAIDIWEQYLIHDSKNITVLTRVADAYRKIRDFDRSREVYLQVLEIEEMNPYAIIGLGHLYYDFKEYRDALFYWGKMLEANPTTVDIRVLTSLGNCHRKLKTFADGVVYFEMGLQREPYNFYALFGLADCYRGMGQQDRSLEYWNRILEQDPRNKVILTRAGDAYRNMGNYEKAVEYYERALNIEFDTYAVMGLAMVAKAQGRCQEASESLRRLIQQDTKNPRPYMELADCYMRMKQLRLAKETLEGFLKLGIRNDSVMEKLKKISA